jgi:hypothetical protein
MIDDAVKLGQIIDKGQVIVKVQVSSLGIDQISHRLGADNLITHEHAQFRRSSFEIVRRIG